MKGLDTDVLVRLLVADGAAQTRRVTDLLESAEEAGEGFFVSSLVLLELAWVLDSAYRCTRSERDDGRARIATAHPPRIPTSTSPADTFPRRGSVEP